jgi:hypothetical protein
MGMDNYIERVNNIKLNTFEELENYDIYDNKDTILCFRRHYWLDNYFRSNCKNSRAYDEVILVKQDIEKLIDKIEFAIKNSGEGFSKDDFYRDDIIQELESALFNFKLLLDEDFENNTIYYDSCS